MKLKERLIDYAMFETTSDETSTTSPSSPGQLVLGKYLVNELKSIGVEDAFLDDFGFVYGSLAGNAEGPAIGLIAHMDTSDAVSGKDVKPRVIENYDGKDIVLSEGIVTEVARFPELTKLVGKTLIVTDGTTLLGADDKAGIAVIMEILEYYLSNPEKKHPLIRIAFTPDEEIGRGTENFNYDWFKVDFAYTLDGGEPQAIEYENFNAASAKVTVTGISTHPGSAKNKMINALNVAYEFHDLLPHDMRPENTEGYEGFNHLLYVQGDCEKTTLAYILRNHDLNALNEQKLDFENARQFINARYHQNLVTVEITDAYRNMKEKFEGHREPLELIENAMSDCNVAYEYVAIRGGTDGAALTWNNVLCPNLGTGGHNCHGRNEFAVVEEMEEMFAILIRLLELSCQTA